MEIKDKEIIKKILGKHFWNQITKIDSYDELPKAFHGKKIFNEIGFKTYSSHGQFFYVNTGSGKYLVFLDDVDGITIMDSQGKSLQPLQLEMELKISLLGYTLEEILKFYIEESNKKVLRMTEDDLVKLIKKVINEQKSGPDYVNFINNLSTVDPNIFNTKKPLEYLQNKLTEYKSKNPGINLDMKTLVQQLLSPTSPFKFTTFKIQTYEPKRVSTMDVNLKNIGFTLSKSDIDPMTIQGGVKLKF